jgi:hypothetical protein
MGLSILGALVVTFAVGWQLGQRSQSVEEVPLRPRLDSVEGLVPLEELVAIQELGSVQEVDSTQALDSQQVAPEQALNPEQEPAAEQDLDPAQESDPAQDLDPAQDRATIKDLRAENADLNRFIDDVYAILAKEGIHIQLELEKDKDGHYRLRADSAKILDKLKATLRELNKKKQAAPDK